MRTHITIFNFGRRNHLALGAVVDDVDYNQQIMWWLSGRVLGRYVSKKFPYRRRLGPPAGRAPAGTLGEWGVRFDISDDIGNRH